MLHSTKRALLVLALSLLPLGKAWSGGFQAEPSAACAFMAADGLPTRGGYRESGGRYHCSSQRRNLVSGGPVNNSIRFIAQGDSAAVTEVRLELQVNSGAAVQRAHRRLVDYSRSLIRAALAVEMPQEIEAAILGATSGNWAVAGSTVSIERIVLGSPGYELRLRIQ